jgi:hypothetical protein
MERRRSRWSTCFCGWGAIRLSSAESRLGSSASSSSKATPSLVRRRVIAEHRGHVALDEEVRHGLVGEEHQLLDEVIGLRHARVVGALLHGERRPGLGVEGDLGLR